MLVVSQVCAKEKKAENKSSGQARNDVRLLDPSHVEPLYFGFSPPHLLLRCPTRSRALGCPSGDGMCSCFNGVRGGPGRNG